MFDYRILRYFITVAEEGGFTAASRKLRIAQSAISRHVASLEQELGGPLFLRQKNGIEVTEAGQRFLLHARDILATMGHARDEISSLLGEPSGSVVIGVPPTAGETLMPELFRICHEKWPAIRLHVRESYSAATYEAVLRKELDMGLVHDPEPLDEMLILPLVSEQMHFIAPGDRPLPERVPASWLRDRDLILPDATFGLRDLLESYAERHRLKLNIAAAVNGVSITKAMVASGLGSTVLSKSAVTHEIARGTLASRPLAPELTWNLCLIMRADRAANRSFSELHRILVQVVQTLSGRGVW
ncbi:LysR family transcriptional regulator [Nisaea acidiphila]|uniref:LysR family transcriptional regulator n=1 Tax=Nisaea acidiphila TaxID=1862145 RepID=A0A9J7AU60_9PROT|nr:LysR family transcriptional regulator [Nisaea acidiphila]UUX50888.1 LysR family transcriptional regulator [Nisaea acidiphila]